MFSKNQKYIKKKQKHSKYPIEHRVIEQKVKVEVK